MAAVLGPGTHRPCKDACAGGTSADVLVQYSDGQDRLSVDFPSLDKDGIALVRITRGAGTEDPSLARLPRSVGHLSSWSYDGVHVFDQRGIDALRQTHAGCIGGTSHFPADIYEDKFGRLEFTLFEE